MDEEAAFLKALQANPDDDLSRLVYADWLDEREDPRGYFLRLQVMLKSVSPDHLDRVNGERELSEIRKSCETAWLEDAEPECLPRCRTSDGRGCGCFNEIDEREPKSSRTYFHVEPQDTECDAWKRLVE
jgi:uncharacterized protein (TIGR02996 family)